MLIALICARKLDVKSILCVRNFPEKSNQQLFCLVLSADILGSWNTWQASLINAQKIHNLILRGFLILISLVQFGFVSLFCVWFSYFLSCLVICCFSVDLLGPRYTWEASLINEPELHNLVWFVFILLSPVQFVFLLSFAWFVALVQTYWGHGILGRRH